jgi:hypothetical protein
MPLGQQLAQTVVEILQSQQQFENRIGAKAIQKMQSIHSSLLTTIGLGFNSTTYIFIHSTSGRAI